MPTPPKEHRSLSSLKLGRGEVLASISICKSATMRLRVTPEQKARITADAKDLGVSATELLLQLHRIASPSLRKKKRR